MYERSLNEAELILSTHKEPLVAVREVWEEVIKRSKIVGFEVATLPDFSALLEGDRRFQLIPGQVRNREERETSIDGELTDIEMDQLGFFSEDRVRLRISHIVASVINEDDEEVGSIRRRAFVSQPTTVKKITLKKQANVVSQKPLKKLQKKKTASKKSESKARGKQVQGRKAKKLTRGKK